MLKKNPPCTVSASINQKGVKETAARPFYTVHHLPAKNNHNGTELLVITLQSVCRVKHKRGRGLVHSGKQNNGEDHLLMTISGFLGLEANM